MVDEVSVKFSADAADLTSKLKDVSGAFTTADQQIADSTAAAIARNEAYTARYKANLAAQIAASKAHAEEILQVVKTTENSTEALEKNTHATVGQKRELMVMGHEIMSGNFSRIPGSFMVLMERTGGLGSAFSALGSIMLNPIGAAVGLTAAAVGIAEIFFSAQKAADELSNAIALTGNSVDKTSGQLAAGAQSVAQYGNVSIGNAKAIELALIQTGKVGASSFDEISQAAANYSRVSGKTAEESATYMAKIFADPAKGARELDDTMHFLRQSDLDYIDTLVRNGDSSDAAAYAASKLNERFGALKDTTGFLTKAMQGWSFALDAVSAKLKSTFDPSDAEKLLKLNSDIANMKSSGNSSDANVQKRILDDQAQAAQLTAKIKVKASQDASDAATTAANTEEKNLVKLANGLDPSISRAKDLTADIDRLTAAMNKPGVDLATEQYKLYAAALEKAQVELDKINNPKQKPVKAAKSDMPEWSAELEQKHDAEQQYFKQSLADDLAFWNAKVAQSAKNGKDQLGAAHEVAALHKKIAVQQFTDSLDAMKLEEYEAKAGSEKRLQIAVDISGKIGEAYGYESKQYIAAQKDVKKAADELDKELEKLGTEKITRARDHAVAMLDVQRGRLAEQKNLGEIKAKEEIASLRALDEQKYQIEVSAQQKIAALSSGSESAKQKELDKLAKMQDKYAIQVQKSNTDMARAVQADWNQMLSPVTNAFDTSIKGVIMGTQTMQKAMQNIVGSIIGEFVNLGLQLVKNWAVTELAKTSLTQTGTTSRSILEALGLAKSATAQTAATVQTIGEKKVEAAATIPAEAAQAAGAAAGSVAGIPVVGPALAAAAYASTMGMVMGGLSVASSAGGEWQVPSDRLNFVHKDETVLPAHIATPLREMVSKGSSGSGDTHVHIHATDADSVKNLIMQNGNAIMNSIKGQIRGFNFGNAR